MGTRRKLISTALTSGLKIMAIGSGLLPLLSATAKAELFGKVPEELPPGQSIYRLQGSVWVDDQLATIDTIVRVSSTIRTGDDGEIIFVIGNDAHILRASSELTLSANSAFETGLKLLSGKILSVFGSRVKDETVTINTSTATIGIRGTGVYLESHPDYSYFCTCYGTTTLATIAGDEQETFTSSHHDQPKYVYRQAQKNQSKIIDAPLINHTDQELALIETLVGRTPPFGNFLESYQRPRRKY